MTHTPGPWFVHQHSPRSFARAITTSPGDAKGDIANVLSGLGSRDVEADARLISAAPDLLEALKRCRFDSLNMSLADLEFCRAAVAKASPPPGQ